MVLPPIRRYRVARPSKRFGEYIFLNRFGGPFHTRDSIGSTYTAQHLWNSMLRLLYS